MSLLTLTINDPGFDKKSAEVAYLHRCLELAANEIHRGNGTVGTGSILGYSASGVANTNLGSWTYSSSASKA